MNDVILNKITKKYGDSTVLNDVSANFKAGKVSCVLGASGVGKTTVLNVISSLTDYTGEVKVDGKLSYVFQSPRLVDTMTVYKNLEFVLLSEYPKTEIPDKINAVLENLGIKNKAKSFPNELSGGEAQRVALARALIYPSDVILMDEPFGALDIGLKYKLIEDFCKFIDNKTVIFVTHDLDEALLLGDDFYVLKDGKFADTFSVDINRSGRDITSDVLINARKRLFDNLTK